MEPLQIGRLRPSGCITPRAVSALMAHDRPGNARELENATEHAMVWSRGGAIEPEALPPSVVGGHIGPAQRAKMARVRLGRGREGCVSSDAGGEPAESRTRGGAAENPPSGTRASDSGGTCVHQETVVCRACQRMFLVTTENPDQLLVQCPLCGLTLVYPNPRGQAPHGPDTIVPWDPAWSDCG